MDLLIANNFNELTYDEQMDTDGGGWPAVVALVVVKRLCRC